MPRYGPVLRTMQSSPPVKQGERFGPYFIDIWCRNISNASLTGEANNTDANHGSDWVEIDWANYVDGAPLPVKKTVVLLSSVNNPPLGVVHWSAGTVTSPTPGAAPDPGGNRILVRVYGSHPYAKVNGTTDVAAGDTLTAHSSAGIAAKAGATPEDKQVFGYALEGHTPNNTQGKNVFLMNPAKLVFV